jgi:hypothetical protein
MPLLFAGAGSAPHVDATRSRWTSCRRCSSCGLRLAPDARLGRSPVRAAGGGPAREARAGRRRRAHRQQAITLTAVVDGD